MANYKETDVAGKTWLRASRVIIDNPYAALPSILFVEDELINLGEGKVSYRPVANLTCSFDQGSQLHADIYTKLNELYILLREARDNA